MSGTNNVVVLPYNSPSYSPSYLNNNDQNSRDLQDLKDQEKQEWRKFQEFYKYLGILSTTEYDRI